MPNTIKYPVIDGHKECSACRAPKPVAEFKPVKNHYSARCIPCRREYEIAYRNRPDIKAKARQYIKDYRQISTNRDRVNAYTRKRNKDPRVQALKQEGRKKWTAREKQKAVDYKGGVCKLCGYDKCIAALDFHHPDPTVKEGLKSHRTFERNRTELDKCVLLCCRCHREIHAGVAICPAS